jgi:hypothetical protein
MLKEGFSSDKFLWLAVIALVPLIVIFFLLPVLPNDYWWYIRLGDEIITSRAVPAIESYSYTQAGDPKINHSWLSSVIFSVLNSLGGIHLTLIVAALLLLLTYYLLWRLMLDTKLDIRWASFLLMLIEIPSIMNWGMRPQLFTFPLFVGSLSILWHWEKNQKDYLWGLPLLMLLWANLHGSFILGFLLVGAALVFGKRDRKKVLLTLVAMALVVLINPRGIGAWSFVLFSMQNASIQNFVTEWQPPVNQGLLRNFFFGWYLLFMLLAGLSSRKLSSLEWVWVLGFGWMAFSASRYDIWFLFIIAPLSAFLLAGILKEPQNAPSQIPAMNIILGMILFILPLLLFPSVRSTWMPDPPSVYADSTPIEAAAWLKDHPELPDPIWADMSFESYLLYALPERPVWIDPRFEVYPPEHWQDYVDVRNGLWYWEYILNENQINVLLVAKARQPKLILALEDSPNWEEIYQDEISLIFIRSEK